VRPAEIMPVQQSLSSMIRRTAALLLLCTFWPCIAQAQDQSQPVSVSFEPIKGGQFTSLNQAIQAALSQPPLQFQARPGPHTLIVSVPDKVEVENKKVSGTLYSFTVFFSRDGSALGQSQQSCNAAKLSDCTDQIVLDVKTAAAPR
jgi:hypothetical protein